MPRYETYTGKYGKDAQSKDLFKNPLVTRKETEFTQTHRDNLIDWITFYRRNMHIFVQHYFGIKLYPYQVIWLYMMAISDSFVAIGSRTTAKTWLLAVFACAKAVLYPNSEIVVVSSTKEQAGILVSDKITSLRDNYPNFAREISNLVTNLNKWEVTFHNGSVIRIVASRDSSRGRRSTFTIYEEFRLIDKTVIDSVIRPFSYIRQTPYLKNPEYEKLGEEPKEVFISSAYHKGLWWFDETKKVIKAMLKGDNSRFLAIDYEVSIRHHIKTKRQIKNEISKMDEITALEEYYNIPWGESATSYFRLKMFTNARNIKKAFYPQRMDSYNPKKNPYGILKTDGEIRLISCDVAQRAGHNDLSISSCIRLLPTHKGYFRELVYMESYSGVDSITQSLRIKQLYTDFEADTIILDVGAGGGGLPMYDQLGQLTKDAERGIEYPPLTIMDHLSIEKDIFEELSKRTLGIGALPVIYPISATAKLNSLIAIDMRDKLQKKMFGFLIDEASAEDYLMRSVLSKEFLSNDDINARARLLAPYVQTSLLINECINLDMTMLAGNIRLKESSYNSSKDRFSSLSYGSYYCSFLDRDLVKVDEETDDFDLIASLVQSV